MKPLGDPCVHLRLAHAMAQTDATPVSLPTCLNRARLKALRPDEGA